MIPPARLLTALHLQRKVIGAFWVLFGLACAVGTGRAFVMGNISWQALFPVLTACLLVIAGFRFFAGRNWANLTMFSAMAFPGLVFTDLIFMGVFRYSHLLWIPISGLAVVACSMLISVLSAAVGICTKPGPSTLPA